MDFEPGSKPRAWHDRTVAFARDKLVDPELLARDERREFWREGWQRCAEFGIQGLAVPEAYGGRGEDLTVAVAALEGLGYGCLDNGLIMALNASTWTVTLPLASNGTEDQKRRWLPKLCDGTLVGANGASEPDAGSDLYAMTTRAERTQDGWRLNGRKTWITAAPIADLFVCYAKTAPDKGVLGITAFLVPADAPGFRLVREIPKMGLRSVPMGEVVFEDCVLPSDAMLGREGRGAEIFQASMDWERGAILAAALGTMRRQVERCVAHARKRKQFGRPIGEFQAVSHRIVDMHVRLETCRPLVHRAARLKAEGRDATAVSALAKLHVSECFVQNSLDAVRVFGASGYTADLGVERELRDSVGGLIYSGTNDIQRNLIARSLGL